MIVMIAAALGAAVLYGAGAAAEQRQAAEAPQSSAGRPRLLLLLARKPLWLLGIGAQLGGFAAHAVALRSGHLATVQMLVAGELVVAVVIVRIWSGRPVGRGSWAAAATVVAAIAAFLAVTSNHGHGQVVARPDSLLGVGLGAAATGGAALAALAVGLRASGKSRAVLLAVAAGLADACSAVVTVGFSHMAGHGLAALCASWTLYALVVVGVGNVLLTQTAYQTGRPMITLPIIAAVTPVASVAVGIGLLGETPKTGAAGAIAVGGAVLIASLALARLARSAPHTEPQSSKPQSSKPHGSGLQGIEPQGIEQQGAKPAGPQPAAAIPPPAALRLGSPPRSEQRVPVLTGAGPHAR